MVVPKDKRSVKDLVWIRTFEFNWMKPGNKGDNNGRHNSDNHHGRDNQRPPRNYEGYDKNRYSHQGSPNSRSRENNHDDHRCRRFGRNDSRDRSSSRDREDRSASRDYDDFLSWREEGDRKSRRVNRTDYDRDERGDDDTSKRKRCVDMFRT